jgi:hypothetical protein
VSEDAEKNSGAIFDLVELLHKQKFKNKKRQKQPFL